MAGLLNLGITKGGQLYINGKPGRVEDLPLRVAELRSSADSRGSQIRAFVSADVKASYGTFAQVVDRLRLEGVTDIALDTVPGEVKEALP